MNHLAMFKKQGRFSRAERAGVGITLAFVAITVCAGEIAEPQESPDVTDLDLSSRVCSITEEKFLPSNYYYCLASEEYGSHHYKAALEHFRTSASWGSKAAQYVLGVMAMNGDQQPIDRPLALAWFSLAAERQKPNFATARQELLATLTPDERARGDQLYAQMLTEFADNVAAARAEKRYRESVTMLARLHDKKDYCFAGVRRGGEGSTSGSNSSTLCVPIPKLTETLDEVAGREFDGWAGHVTVGAIEAEKQ